RRRDRLGAGVAGGIVSVGIARGEADDTRLVCADPDRWALWARTARVQTAVLGLVVLPLEIDVALAEQRDDDLERFLEAAGAVVERVAVCIELRLVVACAKAKDQASAADFVERVGHFGEQGRVAKGGAGHERSERHSARDRRQGAQQRPRLPGA